MKFIAYHVHAQGGTKEKQREKTHESLINKQAPDRTFISFVHLS
jgi:hypothetical protein